MGYYTYQRQVDAALAKAESELRNANFSLNIIDDAINEIEEKEAKFFQALFNDSSLNSERGMEKLNESIQKIDDFAIKGENLVHNLYGPQMEKTFIMELQRISDFRSKQGISKEFYDAFVRELTLTINESVTSVGEASKYADYFKEGDISEGVNKLLSQGYGKGGKVTYGNAAFRNIGNGLASMANGVIKVYFKQMTKNQLAATLNFVNKKRKERGEKTFNSLQDLGVTQEVGDLTSTVRVTWKDPLEYGSMAYFRESDWEDYYKKNPRKALEARKVMANILAENIKKNLNADQALSSIIDQVINSNVYTVTDGKETTVKGTTTLFAGVNAPRIMKGILGEIFGYYIFYCLTGKVGGKVEWTGQMRVGTKKQQMHEDLLVSFSKDTPYGIQIKNYYRTDSRIDYATASGQDFENFKIYIGPDFDKIKSAIYDIYQMDKFNIGYIENEQREEGEPPYIAGNNKDFAGTRAKIDQAKNNADKVLSLFAAALMFLKQSAQINDGSVGNVLTFIGGKKFEASSNILKNIREEIKNDKLLSEDRSFQILTTWEKGKLSGGLTIVDYVNNRAGTGRADLKKRIQNYKLKAISSYNFS